MKLNLQYFAGGHSVTLVHDDGASAFSASSSSDVQKNTEVTLTVTLKTGYEVAKYDVLSGGVTVDPATKKFVMGEADVVIALKTKGSNEYIIVEDTFVNINGTRTELKKNVTLQKSANGGVYGAVVNGTAITVDAAVVAQLVAAGVLVKV